MTPGVHNITVKRNTQRTLPLAYKDATGALVNLTGYSARMAVRLRPDPKTTAALDLSTANGKIALGGTPSNIVVSIDATGVAHGEYHYDLILTDSLGKPGSLLTGLFTVEASTV